MHAGKENFQCNSGRPVVRGQNPTGISIGATADLCFLEAEGIPEAVVSRPKRKMVVKGGKIVAGQDENSKQMIKR